MSEHLVNNLKVRNSTAWMILAGHRLNPAEINEHVTDEGYHLKSDDKAHPRRPWPAGFRFDRWIELARRTPGVIVKDLP